MTMRTLACRVVRVTVAMIAAGLLALGARPAAAADDIVVGVVVPITGVLSQYGQPYADALQIAADRANLNGIAGRKIRLIVEDTQSSNTGAINAVNKVLESKPVAVFAAPLGTQVLAIMPVTEKEKVPLIAGPGTRRVTQQGAKYYFRQTSPDNVDKELSTQFLVEDLGRKKIGILHVSNEWGYSGRDFTTHFLEKYGLKPVSIASYQAGDRDLTAQILQIQKDGADAIFTQGHPVDEALIVKQMRQLNVNIAHVGSGVLCMTIVRSLVSVADIAGRHCVASDLPPQYDERPDMKAFVEVYKKKVGFTPDIYSAQYYDAMNMLAAVMTRYGIDREKIREGFRDTSYAGLLGTYKADEEGSLWHSAVIMRFDPDGTVKVVKRSPGKS